jgi:hypothetical protein
MSNIDVRICRFKNDALFAFSMTYDEGTVDCDSFFFGFICFYYT